ncbi:GT2D2 protein, partial [Polypterus senegalus]
MSWLVIRVYKQRGISLLASSTTAFEILPQLKRTCCYSLLPDEAPARLLLELTELQCDNECRSRQQQISLVPFYRQLDKGKFPEMRTFAKKRLSLFGSTYLCEQTFSVLNLNKNRLRSRLSDSHLRDILRMSTTALEADLVRVLKSRSVSPFTFVAIAYLLLSYQN